MHSSHAIAVLAIALGTIGPVPLRHGADAEPSRGNVCPVAGEESASVAAVDSRLELRLADGRRLRLVGLDPPLPTPGDPDLDDRARQTFLSLIPDRKVAISLVSPKPDRWGRLPAVVFASTRSRADEPGGLAAAAAALGLARYAPEPAAHACRAALLQAETRARQARLGLWRDPYYSVLRVDDQAAFTERSATNVVAQGQLREVEPGPFRTKLRFATREAPYRGRTLVATILPRVMKSLAKDRIDLGGLAGRTLRFRGLLDLRFGPQVEITGPDALEILPDPEPRPAPG